MKAKNINVRIDAEDKNNFEQFCNQAGINVSTAIKMFIKVVLKEQKLPFEVKTDTFDETFIRN